MHEGHPVNSGAGPGTPLYTHREAGYTLPWWVGRHIPWWVGEAYTGVPGRVYQGVPTRVYLRRRDKPLRRGLSDPKEKERNLCAEASLASLRNKEETLCAEASLASLRRGKELKGGSGPWEGEGGLCALIPPSLLP